MKIFQIILIVTFALVVMLYTRPVHADDGVDILNLQVIPDNIKVGDTFSINATIANNNPYPITIVNGVCTSPFFTIFDDHAIQVDATVPCKAMAILQQINPGDQVTVTSAKIGTIFKAQKSGLANATVTLPYHIQNQTNSSLPGIDKTISKSFQFQINEANETYQQKPPAYVALPLQQIRAGTSPDQVICKQGLVLVIKSESDHSACVTQKTAQRLVDLNWGTISQVQNKPIQQTQNTENKFAFSFFSQLSNQEKNNIFFSPYSISDAFSMVDEGAKGNTKNQIESVFGFASDDTQRRNLIKSQNEQLVSTDKYQLSTANSLWIQKDYPILPDYTNTLQNYYKAELTSLDLKGDSENSRNTINKWVENKTNQKIVDLLPSGSINQYTRAVLTNAIYFKANWTNQFAPQDTVDQNFTTGNNTQVKVPTMSQFATFPYYEDNTAQVLEMPYEGDRLSMIVILPKDNLQSLGTISQEQLDNWKDKLADAPVKVYIPKFKLDTKYTLNDMLSTMGVKDAFDSNTADLSGITGNRDLSISTAVHQAYVKVDEKGTEAAAATGIVVGTTAMPVYQYIFQADHPFVFMIYDKQTGLVLFLGQVTNPAT